MIRLPDLLAVSDTPNIFQKIVHFPLDASGPYL